MSQNSEKKLVERITPRDVDFAKWYTDIVKNADLVDYSSVKGCMIIRPYGWAIWENIQKILDSMFKESGHCNVSMPMFIPESLLNKEKEHVEGFAPECAWVTYGGKEKLTERLCVRPTSETLFCEHYANIIKSYRDLPKLYNQWCSVVRWEKTTRPFLRSREFHWQEGHTMHATAQDAQEETIRMLNTYAEFCEKYLAIPVVKGKKTEKEKFAGALDTYTIEALMHDGRALQSGTSHNFGDGFAKAFGVQYLDKDNTFKYCHQTSWGMSTRIIGGIIMTHGDDSGLVLPPAVAPVQVVIVPIATHKEGVLEKAGELYERLKKVARTELDDRDQSPGWKFAEHEMRGVPVRLEIGPRDIENNSCILARRDNGEKISVSLDELETTISKLLSEITDNMFDMAKQRRDSMTYVAENLDELVEIASSKPGFIKSAWCGSEECENLLKEKADVTSRCMPFEADEIGGKVHSDKCVVCGKKAEKIILWGKAY